MDRRWARWAAAARDALPALAEGRSVLGEAGFVANLPSGPIPAGRLGAVLNAVAAEAWSTEEARNR
jgi:hypothetical protein